MKRFTAAKTGAELQQIEKIKSYSRWIWKVLEYFALVFQKHHKLCRERAVFLFLTNPKEGKPCALAKTHIHMHCTQPFTSTDPESEPNN